MEKYESGLEFDNAVLGNFNHSLAQVGASQYPLANLTDEVNHSGLYTRPGLDLPPGIYLDETLLTGTSTVEATFKLQPGSRLGREDSHNFVFFGQLNFGNGREQAVAIKPTDERNETLGELAMTQYIKSIGLPTFKPVGVLGTPEKNYLLTAFEDPVATMDTVDWEQLDTDEKWIQLDYAIDTLVCLHGELLFHGDAFFRNIGFGETGDLIIVDPELTVSARNLYDVAKGDDLIAASRAVQRIKQSMSTDFTSVCTSIDIFILKTIPKAERPRRDPARLKLYKRVLFEPYKNRLLEGDSMYKDVLMEAYGLTMLERKQRAKDNSL